MIFNSGTVGLFPPFPSRLFALDYFLPILSREATICMSSWRTHKDTAHAKAAKWIRRMIRVYTHPLHRDLWAKSCQNKAQSTTETFPKILLPTFHWTIFVQWNTLKVCVKSKRVSALVFSSDHCTVVMMYRPFCWMSAVPFTVGYDGLWSAECYTKESKRSLTLEQIAEVFSSIPCLQFLLVSVETRSLSCWQYQQQKWLSR